MSRVQRSGVVAIVILAGGILVSSRLGLDLSRSWVRLQPPPSALGRWTSKEQKFPESVYDALPGAEIFLRYYETSTGLAGFSVTIISSPFLNNFHNPIYCYKGAGYDEVSSQIVRMKSTAGGLSAKGDMIVMQQAQGGQKLLLFGWYVLGKRRYEDVEDLKWQMARERLFGTAGLPAYFVSVVTPLQGDRERTARGIERFVGDLLPYVRYKYAYEPYLDAEGRIRKDLTPRASGAAGNKRAPRPDRKLSGPQDNGKLDDHR
jgi:hypothetical protein